MTDERDRDAAPSHRRDVADVDSASCRRNQRRVSREGDRIPARDGGSRALRQAVSTMRLARQRSRPPATNATTARRARQADACSPTVRCRDCWVPTGRRASKISRSSNDNALAGVHRTTRQMTPPHNTPGCGGGVIHPVFQMSPATQRARMWWRGDSSRLPMSPRPHKHARMWWRGHSSRLSMHPAPTTRLGVSSELVFPERRLRWRRRPTASDANSVSLKPRRRK